MVDNTKASKGASVTKAGTIAEQPTSLRATGALQELPANIIEDIVMENDGDDVVHSGSAALPSHEKPSSKPQDKRQDHEVIGEQIGRRLRTVYNDVLAQPVPDRFLDLLRELEKDPK